MNRRILEEDDAGRQVDAAHDDVHGGASAGKVDLPIGQLVRDVLVPAQRIEVVLVVVVQRGFVTKPLPDRVRIVVDVEIERVVIKFGGGHGYVPVSDSNALSALSSAAGAERAASGNTTSPTRLRYSHAISG